MARPNCAGDRRSVSLARASFAAALAGAVLAGCGDGLVDRLPMTVGDAVTHHQINYVELKTTDIGAMKAFYGGAFGWTFEDWGPGYATFMGAGVDGGFEQVDGFTPGDSPLLVINSTDLDASLGAVEAAGGVVTVRPFDFPGGRRFHFRDPAGNELAVWTQAPEG